MILSSQETELRKRCHTMMLEEAGESVDDIDWEATNETSNTDRPY